MNEIRMFPIMANRYNRKEPWDAPIEIPWGMISPCESRAKMNHSQSLERLAERGGLCPTEAMNVLGDRAWNFGPHDYEAQKEAGRRLRERVYQFLDEEQGDQING